MVTTAFPRWPNDSRGPSMLETARALRNQGVRVRVVAMHSPGAREREDMEAIEVIRPRYLWPERWETLQQEGGGLPVAWRKNIWSRLAFGPFFLAQTLAVMRYARGFDIIHAHWTLSGMAVWLSWIAHRLPFVLTVHGSDIFLAPHVPLVRSATQSMLNRCQRIIAVSQALSEATVALGIPPNQVEVVPDGIDLDRFRPGPEVRDPLILFVGSLIERKGIRYLLQAFSKVVQHFPDYRLAIVGGGESQPLKSLAAELGIGPFVSFVGPQSQAQIGEWMRKAKVFVLPSLEEALGIVLLEALASGTPCIGTHVGGIPEIISPEVGRLVPAADSEALAEALEAVLADPAQLRIMSRQARQRAEEQCFTWKKVAARLIEIYQTVLAHA